MTNIYVPGSSSISPKFSDVGEIMKIIQFTSNNNNSNNSNNTQVYKLVPTDEIVPSDVLDSQPALIDLTLIKCVPLSAPTAIPNNITITENGIYKITLNITISVFKGDVTEDINAPPFYYNGKSFIAKIISYTDVNQTTSTIFNENLFSNSIQTYISSASFVPTTPSGNLIYDHKICNNSSVGFLYKNNSNVNIKILFGYYDADVGFKQVEFFTDLSSGVALNNGFVCIEKISDAIIV